MRKKTKVILMRLQKIISASLLPIVAALIVILILSALSPVKVSEKADQSIASVEKLALDAVRFTLTILSIAITFWLGYRGVKQFKFGYADAAIAGGIMGIINAAVSGVMVFLIVSGTFAPFMAFFGLVAQGVNQYGGLAVGAFSAFMAGMLLAALFVMGLLGTAFAIAVSLLGALVAKKTK
jgi:hypothetical protein